MVEHDLSLVEYLSDLICCVYGRPGVYGVVTLPFSVRDGINVFLSGFDRNDNLRFRDETLTLKVSPILLLLICSFWATEKRIALKCTSRSSFQIVETPQENAEEIEMRARYK